jgi:hypothetical protein
LESVCTLTAYRGFESHSLRHLPRKKKTPGGLRALGVETIALVKHAMEEDSLKKTIALAPVI